MYFRMKTKQSQKKLFITTISGAVTLIVILFVSAEEQSKPADERPTNKAVFQNEMIAQENRVSPSDFIIFPWGDMPVNPASGKWGDFDNMDAMMRDLYECGFNTSGFIEAKYLEHARNNQLMGILKSGIVPGEKTTQEEADEKIKSLLDSIANPQDSSSVYAIYLCDEPNASLFPQLKIWADAVSKQHVLPYINLFPDYALSQQLGTKDYDEYLDQYVKTCTPPYISYDNYSIFHDRKLDEDRFFGNLESIRHQSLQDNIPFWNVILSNAHFDYTDPSEATLAVQVYSTLAYGGKGIGYFTYYTPQSGNYRLGPVDRFGFRTETWEMMRYINLQIHAIVPELNKLTNVNVFHTGQIPRNGQDIRSAKNVGRININAKLLVGEFHDTEGRPYAMIVNKDLQLSVGLDFAFKKFNETKPDTVIVISQFDQGKRVLFNKGNNWLAPGCGVLVTVK